jgi:hypothetical protein
MLCCFSFSMAQEGRSLSLPARCAFVMTKAQRAPRKHGWLIGKGENNLRSEDFSPAGRCALVIRNAQRVFYDARPIICST